VADDPWRKPDPSAPAPPPAYGPPPGYAPMPYGPPGAPYNPYQAPLPKRGGFKRLLWILCTVGVLVLGGCGVGIYLLAKSVTKNADAVNAFLRDVRDSHFDAAYQRLCPDVRSAEPQLPTQLQAAAGGHAVTSFDITASNTSVSSGIGTTRTASGTVTFTGGLSTSVVFSLGQDDGRLCIQSGYASLL
jgi:hypothetical protein